MIIIVMFQAPLSRVARKVSHARKPTNADKNEYQMIGKAELRCQMDPHLPLRASIKRPRRDATRYGGLIDDGVPRGRYSRTGHWYYGTQHSGYLI